MSNCTNCFNGCTEITSDQCVKYTGIEIPELNINTGDTLAAVEAAITTYLVNTLDGSGIYPLVSQSIICEVISKYFAECAGCDGLSLNELLTAMVKAICDLQGQINTINQNFADLEDAYSVECLSGVVSDSGTHDILQATISKLCDVDTSLSEVILSLTTYVTAANVNSYIAAYISSDPTQSLISNRMVPYSAVPYFGPLSGPNSPNFDSTGAGTGNWDKIYLCNGLNANVPDLRGRVLVGVTTGIPGGAFNINVDPALGNPSYEINNIGGTNSVTLNQAQLPSHAHPNTVNTTLTDPKHSHNFETPTFEYKADFDTNERVWRGGYTTAVTTESATGITVNTTITNAPFGSGEAHPNIQPVYASYYIIYIP
jgi:microcystin-dependent protein